MNYAISDFDAKKTALDVVNWVKQYFQQNGPTAEAVIGISGGKDSTVCAAVCIAALGKGRVVGIQMPHNTQRDMQDSNDVIKFLGIKKFYGNIAPIVNAYYDIIDLADRSGEIPTIVKQNLPPRVRTTMLYTYANRYGARVACTGNLSETYIGWSTRWGDDVGDFAPFENLTASEVVAIGDALGIPSRFTHKIPEDGLTHKSDEENFGFSYKELDAYIRGDRSINPDTIMKIEAMHARSEFKRQPIPKFLPILS